jgi:hypothetical protein
MLPTNKNCFLLKIACVCVFTFMLPTNKNRILLKIAFICVREQVKKNLFLMLNQRLFEIALRNLKKYVLLVYKKVCVCVYIHVAYKQESHFA